MKRLFTILVVLIAFFPALALADSKESALSTVTPGPGDTVTGLQGGTNVNFLASVLGSPFALGVSRNAAITAITSGSFVGTGGGQNVTVTGGCAVAAGNVTCTGSSGAGTVAPYGWTPVANTMYQVDVLAGTAGTTTLTLSMGGVTYFPAITETTGYNYRFYVYSGNTTNLSIAGGASGTVTQIVGLSIQSIPNPYLIVDSETLTVQNNVYLPNALKGYVFQSYNTSGTPAAVVLNFVNSNTGYLAGTSYSNSITLGAARQTFISLGCFANGTYDLLGQNGSATGS
jgi:hypothetical protein